MTDTTVTAAGALAGDAPAAETAAEQVTTTSAGELAADTPATEEAKQEQAPGIQMPGKDATPEQWGEFYKQIGRPETADEYELPVPEGDDGAFAKQMAPILHKNGITAAQAQGLAADWNAMQAEIARQQSEAQAQELAAMSAKNKAEAAELQNEWGEANAANMQFAKLAVQQFVPKEKAADVINAIESVLGYKGAVQMLYGIGKGLGEADAAGLNANGSAAKKSLAERLYPNMK